MPDSSAPTTARVVDHILAGARSGSFRNAELLPGERELSRILGVSRSTVAAAYSKLESRGLVSRVRGKGTFLCAPTSSAGAFSWIGKVSKSAHSLDEPVLELLARSRAQGIRFPLSAGSPSLAAFPRAAYTATVSRVLSSSLPSAFIIGSAEGRAEFREALAGWLKIPHQHLMVTAGAQEGIDLVARCLMEQGDRVVTDSPCYPGALQSFLSAGARLIPWSTEWSLPALEKLFLQYRPKLLFTTPTFHNPTGRVMGLRTRTGLLALAHKYGVPIVEDSVYNASHLKKYPLPASLYLLDQNSLVIACGTLSKLLAPGLRIGWLAAPLYMIKQISLVKMRANLFTDGLNQLVLTDFIRDGLLDKHLECLRSHHRELRDAAIEAFRPSLENGLLRFRVPEGGLYLWCKVLAPIEMELFFESLELRGVSLAPGSAFEVTRSSKPSAFFRLCYTVLERPELLHAISLINTVLMRLAKQAGRTQSASFAQVSYESLA